MAKEILAIPEHLIPEVILIIRAGLFLYTDNQTVSDKTRDNLRQWCDDMEEYLERLEKE